MKIITAGGDINSIAGGADIYPGIPYLMPDESVRVIRDYEASSGFRLIKNEETFSGFCNWKHPSRVKTLLIYISGRIGDHLWLTAVTRKIKKLHPEVQIDVVATPTSAQLWDHSKDVRGTKYIPMPFAAIQEYDAIIILDEFIASMRGARQDNCYVALFNELGLPFEVEDLKPVLNLKFSEEHLAFSSLDEPDEDGNIRRTRGHFVISLHTSSRSRNMHWLQIRELVLALGRFSPGTAVYGFSNNEYGGNIQQKLLEERIPYYVASHNRLSVRQIATVCRLARCVFTGDTMFAHLAAAVNAPTVAVMSTVPPHQRVGTYPFCVPIYKKEACSFAPCFWKGDSFRRKTDSLLEIAPCYTPQKYICDVVKEATVGEMLEAANEAMKKRSKFDGFNFPNLPI